MKEERIQWYKVLKGFWHDVLKRTVLFFIVGCLIVVVFQSLRGNPLSYIILFVLCFGFNFFTLFFKREIKKEFYGDY